MVCADMRSSETFRLAHSPEFAVIQTRTGVFDAVHKGNFIGVEVLSAVVAKNSVFGAITPSSPSEVDISEKHVVSIFRVEE
jgi:hypothetical protein